MKCPRPHCGGTLDGPDRAGEYECLLCNRRFMVAFGELQLLMPQIGAPRVNERSLGLPTGKEKRR